MRRIITLLVTFILTFVSLFSFASAENNEILKNNYIKEIENLKKEILNKDWNNIITTRTTDKNNEQDIEELNILINKLSEVDYKLAELEWKVYNNNDNLYRSYSSNNLNFINILEPWDIITIKYKPWHRSKTFEKLIGDWWHTMIVLNKDEFVEAPWWKDFSRKVNIKRYFSDTEKTKKIDQIAISRVNMTKKYKDDIVKYIEKNLIWKPYPRFMDLPDSKYTTLMLYCSSLVWNAHFNSWKRIDLDPNSWKFPDIIFPYEIVLFSNARLQYYVNF